MPTKDSSYLLVCETSQGRDSDLKSGIVSATFGDFIINLHSWLKREEALIHPITIN